MSDVRRLLESERETERRFAADAKAHETTPKGWPASLLLFHLAQWRGRMVIALSDIRDGRPQTLPPENTDEFNDVELSGGAGVSLEDATARCDEALASMIELYDAVGERPFSWRISKTTTEAVVRSGYIHPRLHIVEYMKENGDTANAYRLVEKGVSELRDAGAPPAPIGTAIYNLACVRVAQGKVDEALKLLEEAIALRSDLAATAAIDPDLAALRDHPGFRALVSVQPER
jgi:hypothetical protein